MTMVSIICGPPGSGKTTYVRERARWGDLIIDLDAIYAAIGGTGRHEHPANLVPYALAARDALLNSINGDLRHAWIVMGGAKKEARRVIRERYNAKVVVLETGPSECLKRIQADAERATP